MTIRPLVLAVALAVALAAAVVAPIACATDTPPAVTNSSGEKLAEILSLTPKQVEQLKAIRATEAQAIKNITQDTVLTPAQKESKLKGARSFFRERREKVLTPAQQQRLRDFEAGKYATPAPAAPPSQQHPK